MSRKSPGKNTKQCRINNYRMNYIINLFVMNNIGVFIVTYLIYCHNVHGVQQSLRRKVIIRQGNVCGLCKCKFSKIMPHEIHHLNHNPKDNTPSNLLALCANCHTAHHRFGVPVSPFDYNNSTNYSSESKAYYEQ